jgi:hypothetical protein
MSVKFISSSNPKYLASADLLIGDMSDINYEYLLYNKPVVLLANDWLTKNFPDIGVKTSIKGLVSAVRDQLKNPVEYEAKRKVWLGKTFNFPKSRSASIHILDIAIEKSGYSSPKIVLLHGNNITRESNIRPIYEEGKSEGLDILLVDKLDESYKVDEVIFIAAHFDDLHIGYGFKVHLDHGLKGVGTANLDISVGDYKRHNFFPKIDLHITAGPAGFTRTVNLLLGPNKNRAIIGAYPKADVLLALNTAENRISICKELKFNPKKKIIVYAPSGQLSWPKPGGSLSMKSLFELFRLSMKLNVNVIVKLKNKRHGLIFMPVKWLINSFNRKRSIISHSF